MNTTDFAARIQLHPRAIVMLGTAEGRMKNGGTLPGLTPHYAMPGCPLIQFNGANALEEPNPAEIEFSFQETGFPLPSALQSFSPKQGNFMQLMFGRNGQAATAAAYRVLREASSKIAPYIGSNRQIFAVSLPILTPGSLGVTAGRHYLMGLFETDGTPIWIHPDAKSVFKAEFPADQRERSIAGAPSAPAAGSWYEPMRAALAYTGLKGKKLEDQVLKVRAGQLVEQGVAPDMKTAMAIASADLSTRNAASEGPGVAQEPPKAAQPASSRQDSGRKLMTKQ